MSIYDIKRLENRIRRLEGKICCAITGGGGGGGTYELNLTTLGTSGVATYNAGTDTLNVPDYSSGGGTSSRFGIEDNTGVQNRSVDMGAFNLSLINGNVDSTYIFSATNTANTGIGIYGNGAGTFGTGVTGNGGSVGVSGQSTNGYGGNFASQNGPGLQAATNNNVAILGSISHATTNTVRDIVKLSRSSTGVPSNGIGGSLTFSVMDAGQFVQPSNTLVSKWTDAATLTRTSQFQLIGVTNAINRTLTFPSLTADRYSPLSVNNQVADATGNIILDLVTVTKAAADTLIAGSLLIPGQNYLITGVHTSLYGGTDIILRAFSTTKFEVNGHGVFYNPIYSTVAGDYGIWNTVNSATSTTPVGTFKPGETITNNLGGTGVLLSGFSLNKVYFTITAGTWVGATSITGSTSAATSTISALSLRTYNIGDNAIWGGYKWTNVNGNLGASTTILALNSEWTKIAYNTTDYNQVIDPIQFDYTNNIIAKRSDTSGNVVTHEVNDITYFNTTKGLTGTPINVFPWGNTQYRRNSVTNSYFEGINLMGGAGLMIDNILTVQSIVAGNFFYTGYIGSSANYLARNTLHNRSEFRNNIFIEGGSLDSSTLEYNSTINSNRFYYNVLLINAKLRKTSTINSNEVRKAAWQDMVMFNNSQTNSNICNQSSSNITKNNMNFSTFNSNTINNTYFPATGSDRFFLHNNEMSYAQINSNTFNITSNGRTIGIAQNIFLGDQNQDTPIRYSGFTGCTFNNGSNLYVRFNTLRTTMISNMVVGNSQDFIYNKFENLVWDYAGANADGLNTAFLDNKLAEYKFSKTFTGAAGSGAIGAVTITPLIVPIGYFISEVLIDVGAGLVDGDATLNLGIATDNTQAGINDVIGQVTNLNNAGITRILPSTFTKATATRNIVMEVKTAALTSGTATFIVKLNKLS